MEYTDEQYRDFRNLLAAFCDQVRANYAKNTDPRGNPARQGRIEARKAKDTRAIRKYDSELRELGLTINKNEIDSDRLKKYNLTLQNDKFFVLPNQDKMGVNFCVSGGWNGPNFAYLNVRDINIIPQFANEDGKIVQKSGSHVIGFKAGIMKHDVTEGFTPISELGLDDDGDSTTPALKNLFNQYMQLLATHTANIESEPIMADSASSSISDYITSADSTHENIIFHGAPGTGKTYGVLKTIYELLSARGLLEQPESVSDPAASETVRMFKSLKESPYFAFVQFHPSYDYTDFVEGLRPVQGRTSGTEGDDAEETVGSGFALKAGTFMRFCAEARNNPDQRYYFLIDEINRGDISNIFGELFFLLDKGYRGMGITTQYSNLHNDSFKRQFLGGSDEFDIPENVTIIGTMNDIDRSVDSFDFAMRRRFRFIEVTWEQSLASFFADTNEYPGYALVKDLMTKMNAEITKMLNADYSLGASYFRGIACADAEHSGQAAESAWKNQIEPLLREYLRGTDDPTNNLRKLTACWKDTIAANSHHDGANDQDTQQSDVEDQNPDAERTEVA